MAGKKTFVAGEVLLAQDVNDYLMDQTIMNFASSAARSSAIPTPTEGMFTVTTDNDQLDYYNGSGWVPALPVGAWEAYTPTFTNLTLGNATIDFKYARLGKTVFVRGTIIFGSTTAMTGNISLNGPANIVTATGQPSIGNARYADASAGTGYLGNILSTGGNTWVPITSNVSATYPTVAGVGTAVPFTWAQSDTLTFYVMYQAA
jgi:hypothetical protein